ncbi:MAG: ABC transporter ATP-binding protein [Chloroflexi bacterium]|jgi:ABC-type multidrug transport system fused ATPase/permease subunit|nr:ABC transporter ATP-binding protein [Chloroflexota bacterium]MBT7081306.1 ABC transporter ATP-binding protein [Chloroflexota bacterium]MBT7290401.1 ABC transporter ATP-binding protein [Chloroflexota bacterium]
MITLVRLTGFAKKYWILLLASFICLLATIAFALAMPWFLRMAIDTIDPANYQGSRSFLTQMALAVVGASILRGIFAYGQSYLSEVASQKTAYDIRNALYDRLQRLCFSYHDVNQTGQLMSRATADVEAVRMFVSMGLVGLLQYIAMTAGIVTILVIINWQLALMSMAVLPVIAAVAIFLNKRMRPIWTGIQQMIGKLGIILEENLTGVTIVKAFSRQKDESRKFANQTRELYNRQRARAQILAINMPLMVMLMTIPVALILWYGGRQIIGDALTIGELTQFIFYLGILIVPTRRLGMLTNVFSRSASAGQRIMEILDAESSIIQKPDAIDIDNVKGQVAFDNVTFKYNAVSPALKKATFEVSPGQTVAMIGASGSGKSTIANLLPRFYDVSSGNITIDGIDIRDITLPSLRNNVGIAQQDIFLFSASIRDNIAYGLTDATDEQIIDASKAAHLHEFIETLPQGYNTWVGERGVNLSGGEKQRLSIARTLLMNTPILILDDSTSSVDIKTEHIIIEALNRLIEGRTTFIITHRLPIIRNADLILVLEHGHILEQGNHDQLISGDGLYKQIYESQLLMLDGQESSE